ncbi:MAG: G8 domain-containing protein, partial [Pseudomonadota bacterium]
MTDDHDIGHLSGDHEEHLAAIDLATEADATHVAIASGDWFDPSIWDGGVVPGDDARVFIPEHFEVDYAGGDGARIFTIGVEGALRFDPEADSQLIVDTLIVAPGGKLEVGTDDAPVTGAVDIVIANNGAIDVDWDPQLLSRGIVSLGDVSIHGTEVQSHVKVAVDPMAGDTTLTLALSDIEGWSVGDVIVVAGTDNPGHSINAYDREYRGDTNETRTIVAIDGDTVTLDQPLDHDHATPRADLKTSVANMSRSITIRSEDGAESAVHERGHVMFMGSDDVEVRFASFEDLGRTDKSVRSAPATSFEDIAFDSNAQGRYSLHLHKLGVENQDEPIWVEGNSVTGSPGWGIVQHSSNANLHNNAVIDVFASSFVSEAGDETGTWSNNISLGNIGMLGIERDHADVAAGDLARTGSGFWLQSRLVDVVENIAVATRTGFVWIAQGSTEEVDASLLDQPESLGFGETVSAQQQAISLAQDNEVFGSERGMTVTKGHPNQNH